MAGDHNKAFPRQIPPMDRILQEEKVRAVLQDIGWAYGVSLLNGIVDNLRKTVLAGDLSGRELEERVRDLGQAIRQRSAGEARPGLVPLINATGVIVHTNLGRALLGEEARRRVNAVGSEYVNLEYDLSGGRRGKRQAHVGRLLTALFPGFENHVVNNNAAAVLLALNSLAEGKECVVSRGELVEIGGSFRIPEILAKSGARLREVGTTNRTRLADYARAVGPETGILLRVHASNYRIVGFVESVPLEDLAGLARERSIPLVVDEGSGNLHDLQAVGIDGEPTVGAILAGGADLVMFSGDKLLGGPQAGILVGKPDLVDILKSNPLSRALRVDKMTLAALEGTLLAHRRGTHGRDLPVQAMMMMPLGELQKRVERFAEKIRRAVGDRLEVKLEPGESVIGGGAAPATSIPTRLIALKPVEGKVSRLCEDLRKGNPPVITRSSRDSVLVDLRTVPEGREDAFLEVIRSAMEKPAAAGKVRR